MADIGAALAQAQTWVGTVPGVAAVGEGRSEAGQPTIDVWVTRQVELPAMVQGIEVRVREGGEFRAQH
jgi:hypothetical protein